MLGVANSDWWISTDDFCILLKFSYIFQIFYNKHTQFLQTGRKRVLKTFLKNIKYFFFKSKDHLSCLKLHDCACMHAVLNSFHLSLPGL